MQSVRTDVVPAAAPPPAAGPLVMAALGQTILQCIETLNASVRLKSPALQEIECALVVLRHYIIDGAKKSGFSLEVEHELYLFLVVDGKNWRDHLF